MARRGRSHFTGSLHRFVNRNLFKYVEFDPAKEYKKLCRAYPLLFKKAGIDPEYYLVVDSSSDLAI